ncbi:MAG TPA: S46 family peptidase, partial [Prolixibacteraceae bacterium]|nr:S46 family peptidase [Prolixibacteraceae bacterium]
MRKLFALLVLLSVVLGPVKADEGMWLPSLVQKLNMKKMQQLGLQLSAEDIYSINHSSLKDAVVALDRGSCTAELVSPDGLLLTNHHCAYGEIQSHSSVEHDYLQDGFWAKTRDEELPNPGKSVSFLIRVEEVTARVLANVTDGMSREERTRAIGKVSSDIEKEAIAGTHYEAQVRGLFEANKYYLFVYEVFTDVRLVGAPPQSLGKFGGDTDN